MSTIAGITWLAAVLAGLLMLAIWLIELDRDYQRRAATRLPVPVLSAHALLGLGGLPIWIAYIITGEDKLSWTAVVILACAAPLGVIMAFRWLGVYRAHATGTSIEQATAAIPPERHIPPAAVIVHGLFAGTTVTLVVLTALGVGPS